MRGVDMHIRTPHDTLDPIPATVGVKQGCPLSPLLFGIYIDSLHQHVTSHCPDIGPTLRTAQHLRLSLLIYADDTALLADSEADLQALLACAESWCDAHGMSISTIKSEVVVFNNARAGTRRHQHARVFVHGKQLPVKDAFKYLGVWFHCNKGVGHHVQKAANRGKAAIAGMNRRMGDLAVGSNVYLSLDLYQSLVLPAMLYGCEVWGSALLGCADPATSTLMPEKVHRNFVKFTLRMRSKTKAWVAFREAGMFPLQYTCLHRMLTFLDSVMGMADGEFTKVAMTDCIAQANAGARNWFSHLRDLLNRCAGGTVPSSALQHDGTVNVQECLLLWRQHHYRTVWGSLHPDPRSAPSDNITLCTYHAYFATPLPSGGEEWLCAPCIAANHIPYHHLISLINMRTNSHTLNIERMRHLRPRVPRAARACPWCRAPGAVQDELHCILECSHFSQKRLQYPRLFTLGAAAPDMRMLFTDGSLTGPLASFVHMVLGTTALDNQLPSSQN